MKPIFFKELKSYTIEYLSKKLEIDNEYMDELIKNLFQKIRTKQYLLSM